jgi:hypothetical protein
MLFLGNFLPTWEDQALARKEGAFYEQVKFGKKTFLSLGHDTKWPPTANFSYTSIFLSYFFYAGYRFNF